MSHVIRVEHVEAYEAHIAPAMPTQEEDTYEWSYQDIQRAIEVLNAPPKPLTPMALSAREAHTRLFGASR